MAASPSPDPLPLAVRAVVWANGLAGVALCAVAVGLAGVAVRLGADPAAPHGGGFQWAGAVVLLPTGVLLLVAARSHARRRRFRWALQALPLLWLALMAMWLR